MTTKDKPTVTITRRKWASRGAGYAWHWRYDADLPDGTQLRGFETLADIRSRIKRAGCGPVKGWQS